MGEMELQYLPKKYQTILPARKAAGAEGFGQTRRDTGREACRLSSEAGATC
jgi:hypothetical protein